MVKLEESVSYNYVMFSLVNILDDLNNVSILVPIEKYKNCFLCLESPLK
jgi:hypothetical protein